MLTEHGLKIAPSTYYERVTCPVSAAELTDAYAANALVDLYRLFRIRSAREGVTARGGGVVSLR